MPSSTFFSTSGTLTCWNIRLCVLRVNSHAGGMISSSVGGEDQVALALGDAADQAAEIALRLAVGQGDRGRNLLAEQLLEGHLRLVLRQHVEAEVEELRHGLGAVYSDQEQDILAQRRSNAKRPSVLRVRRHECLPRAGEADTTHGRDTIVCGRRAPGGRGRGCPGRTRLADVTVGRSLRERPWTATPAGRPGRPHPRRMDSAQKPLAERAAYRPSLALCAGPQYKRVSRRPVSFPFLPPARAPCPTTTRGRRNGPGAANAPPPPAPRSASRPGRPSERPPPGPRVSRGVKIGAVLGLFLFVAAGAVAVYFWLRPPDPFRLVLVGAGYDQNLAVPSNALGRRGLDGLETVGQGLQRQAVRPREGQERRSEAPGHRGKQRPRRRGGRHHQRPHGRRVSDRRRRRRRPGRLRPARERRAAQASTPPTASTRPSTPSNGWTPETRKLLLLDASSNGPDWAMRQLHNDFIRSVKKLEPRIKEVPNLRRPAAPATRASSRGGPRSSARPPSRIS